MDKVSNDPKGRLKIQSSQRKTGFPSKESGLFYSKLRNLFSRQRGRSVRLRGDVFQHGVLRTCGAVGKVARIDKPFKNKLCGYRIAAATFFRRPLPAV